MEKRFVKSFEELIGFLLQQFEEMLHVEEVLEIEFLEGRTDQFYTSSISILPEKYPCIVILTEIPRQSITQNNEGSKNRG